MRQTTHVLVVHYRTFTAYHLILPFPVRTPASSPANHSHWVTGGSKFGGDFLAYPGDPSVFHAQFVVRVVPTLQPLPVALLAGAVRGAHAARKHLLLAAVREDGQGALAVEYVTIAPEAGFAAPKDVKLNKAVVDVVVEDVEL